MYICKYCKRECKSIKSVRSHQIVCKDNPSYDEHKYSCKWCSRYSSSKNGNSRHEKQCKLNPDRRIEKGGWNKGLTVADERVRQNVENMRKANIGKSRKHTLESRKKISIAMKGNHNNNPSKTGRGKKGRYKGIYCSSSYELAFLIYCLDHDINIQKYEGYYEYFYKDELHRYYPDFIIDGTIFEIKGFWSEVVDAKTLAVKDKPIQILYYDDLKEVFDYIEKQYRKRVDVDIHELYDARLN